MQVNQLTEQPYATVLCFPEPKPNELKTRIMELRSLGVEALEFTGDVSLFGVKVPVLGKGFVGIVVAAYVDGERAAAKILRLDSGRENLLHEAEMLKKANSVGVAPKLLGATKHVLLMQLIDGDLLPKWLEQNREPSAVRQVLAEVLEQCWRLDEAGLDHGELSKAPKHILVDKAGKPFIVDFETASEKRRAANVTAVCQYLFMGNSGASKRLMEILGQKDTARLKVALREYKTESCRVNFEALLQICLS